MAPPSSPVPAQRGRLYPDDDMYRIHSAWLGPKGRTLPFQIPYRALPPGFAAFLVALILLRGAGASGPVLYGIAIAAACLAGGLAARLSGSERPVTALFLIVYHEITAPRPAPPSRQVTRAVLRPDQVTVSAGPARPELLQAAQEAADDDYR
jgi:hypothetical protein